MNNPSDQMGNDRSLGNGNGPKDDKLPNNAPHRSELRF
jgi:hypothetical protein